MYQKNNYWVKAATAFFTIFILLGNYGCDLLAIYRGIWVFGYLARDMTFHLRCGGGGGGGVEMSL